MEAVDAVAIYDDETPLRVVEALRPDVLAKGADWPLDQIVGRAEVEATGGRVVRIPLVEGRSTTAILERIRTAVTAWTDRVRASSAVRAAREALHRPAASTLGGDGSARLLLPPLIADGPLIVVVPTEREVDRVALDLRTLAAEPASRARCCPFPRPVRSRTAGLPRHPGVALERARRAARRGRGVPCARWWRRPRACSAPRSAATSSRPVRSRSRPARSSSRDAPGSARRGRLPPRGSRHRTRPDGPPRRRLRPVPARPRVAGPRRILRRHRGEPAGVRSRHPAHGRRAGRGRHHAALGRVRAALGDGAPARAACRSASTRRPPAPSRRRSRGAS
jgi:hypothetical protein